MQVKNDDDDDLCVSQDRSIRWLLAGWIAKVSFMVRAGHYSLFHHVQTDSGIH
jgi:hypothetical protein